MTAARASATRQRPEPAPAMRPAPTSASGSRDRLLRLQRLAGNQAVAAQLSGIPVAPPDGPFEAEADAAGARAGRHGLSGPLRGLLGRVRIHTDARAEHAAQRLGAAAFTLGGEIYFNRGRFEPGTADGQALLAHELTHVAQQDRGTVPAPVQRCACGGEAGPTGECAACRARRLAAKRSPVIQRQPLEGSAVPSRFPVDAAPGVTEQVSPEKWSPTLEAMYVRRGDFQTAAAIRTCRTSGGEACSWLLTIGEVWALKELAERAQGDEKIIKAGLAGAAPLLAPRAAPPLLRLVPMPPPVAGPALGPAVGAAGAVVIIAVLVYAGLELWALTKLEAELRARGFVILESPQSICTTSCHVSPAVPKVSPRVDPFRPPQPLSPPPATPLPAADLEAIRRWLEGQPQAGPPQKGTTPAPQPATVPQATTARKYANQTCEDAVREQLEDEMHRVCEAVRGKSCSTSKYSPKTLARRPCSEIRAQIQSLRDCIAARQKVQDVCFAGSTDQRHVDTMAELNRAIAACLALEAQNCAKGHPMAEL